MFNFIHHTLITINFNIYKKSLKNDPERKSVDCENCRKAAQKIMPLLFLCFSYFTAGQAARAGQFVWPFYLGFAFVNPSAG
jgi:hypothetical protein